MKTIVTIVALASAFVTYADFWDYQQGYDAGVMDGTTHTTVINPKYSVAQAIDVCIKDMDERGEAVNEINLKRALRRMSEGDVCLPSRKSDLNKLIRNAVQKYNKRAYDKQMRNNPPPNAADYATQKEFVAAYVSYREENMSPTEKDQWSKKLGGMNEFRRTMKNNAIAIWKRKAKGKAGL